MTATAKQEDRTSGLANVLLVLATVALLAVIVLGIRGCVNYDRQQETACRAAGGMMTTVGTNTGCYKVTAEPMAIP